jgi:hypothetical protein
MRSEVNGAESDGLRSEMRAAAAGAGYCVAFTFFFLLACPLAMARAMAGFVLL